MVDLTHPAESRSATIFRHTRAMQQATGCSMQTFAARVIEHYHAAVPQHLRDITFKSGGDVYRDAQTNAQHLARWMNPDESTRMPVDIEESWVAGLGEPFAAACRRDLARRYGLLDVPVMESQSDLAAVGTLTQRLGEVLRTVSPALAGDNEINARDLEHLPGIKQAIDSLVAAALGLKHRVSRVARAARSRGDA